ncbi:MAG TPA: cation:proton antiporter [Dehalococcoidia bacterium]|jgi:Kef-type K+ transport system membrane component KefB|nr:cation:proton antiporter [Dehalococcoidia bacterium]
MSEQGILASIEFQMSLLLFVALAGYLIAYRINQSAVVGIILAGIVVGPSLLGWVEHTDFVSSLGHLGAVVLLFTIGLHFNIKDIANVKYFLIALAGIIVPWIAGFYLAKMFGYDTTASVFIGTALTATSIAITANVLKEMGKLQTEAAKAIIGAAIIDDVLSLLALTISAEIVSGALSPPLILVTILKAIAFLVIGVILGSKVISRIMIRLDNTRFCGKYPESIFIFAIMVAFLYSLVAELAGLSAIIGSFLAGVALTRVKLKHDVSFRKGAEHLQIIFASIFFISLGVLLDFHEVTLDLVWFILILTIVALFTKFIGCGVPAKLQGINTRDSLIIGVGMIPRGEVAMIIALIGLNQNLIMQDTYAALVLMSLLTTIIPPLILRNWLFKVKSKKKKADGIKIDTLHQS